MTISGYALAVLLVIHGAISVAQVTGGGASLANPSWLGWWPTSLGESWLPLGSLGFSVGRLLWLVSGVALLGAGLGLLGVAVPREAWRALAVVGAAASIPVLATHIHPFYLPVTVLNVGIVVGLLWLHWPAVSAIGS